MMANNRRNRRIMQGIVPLSEHLSKTGLFLLVAKRD